MRILHICSGSSGGAAVAAYRLSTMQTKLGDKTLIVDVNFMEINGRRRFHQIQRKALSWAQQLFTKKEFGVLTPFSYPYLKLKIVRDFNPDVIHIHNWYNMINYPLLKEISNSYPIVFTLHDERLLTGGCHNTLGCTLNTFGCKMCPATHVMRKFIASDYLKKSMLFRILPQYAIVAPSDWLTRRATASGLFTNAKVVVKISNIIENNIVATNKNVENQSSEKNFRILFIAADISVKLKGFQLLLNAFEELTKRNKNQHLVLTAVGAMTDEVVQLSSNGKIVYKRPVNQPELRKLMKENSILVVPSLADNAPNIIAESQMEGTIVIASDLGGIPEMIENEVTGFLTRPNVADLIDCISRVQSYDPRELSKIRDRAKKRSLIRHDANLIAQNYTKLYKTLGAKTK